MDYQIFCPTNKPFNDPSLVALKSAVAQSEPLHTVHMSCIVDGSAAKNRNHCLDHCSAEYIVMIDDDVRQFPADFALRLVTTLQKWAHAAMCSAKLMNGHGEMFMGGYIQNTTKGIGVSRAGWVPTACVAFRKTERRFDESLPWVEDVDWCWSVIEDQPDAIFIVDNSVQVYHANEEKWRKGDNVQRGQDVFKAKWGRLP